MTLRTIRISRTSRTCRISRNSYPGAPALGDQLAARVPSAASAARGELRSTGHLASPSSLSGPARLAGRQPGNRDHVTDAGGSGIRVVSRARQLPAGALFNTNVSTCAPRHRWTPALAQAWRSGASDCVSVACASVALPTCAARYVNRLGRAQDAFSRCLGLAGRRDRCQGRQLLPDAPRRSREQPEPSRRLA
jgi:hypothetical protein